MFALSYNFDIFPLDRSHTTWEVRHSITYSFRTIEFQEVEGILERGPSGWNATPLSAHLRVTMKDTQDVIEVVLRLTLHFNV